MNLESSPVISIWAILAKSASSVCEVGSYQRRRPPVVWVTKA